MDPNSRSDPDWEFDTGPKPSPRWPDDWIGPDAHDCWRDPEPKLRDGRMMIHVGCDECSWGEWIDVTGLSDAAVIARAEEAWAVHEQSPVPFQ